MTITKNEKTILQELAKQYAELAALPVQKERRTRGRDINDLKPSRPMVWLDELPWHEMNLEGALDLACENSFARDMELFFRRTLYRWKYIQADMVVEDAFYIHKAYSSTGMGIHVREDILSNDDTNHIVSHSYLDQLDTPDKVAALEMPVLTAHPDLDKQHLELAADILGDILPARLRGHYLYHAPWDDIPRFRGVTQTLTDLACEPEHTHAIMKKFSDAAFATVRQMEQLGLFDWDIQSLHCTPPYVSDFEGTPPGAMKNSWFRGMAQLFTEVSPAMFEEFELDYVKPLMAEFGLSYYGCCEALETKIQLLKTVPNLRKIGVSPWASAESCAEQIGKDYVFAHKPNPARVTGSFDKEAVEKEISHIIELCKKYNCPLEFVLKDVSTCSYKPQNLIAWVDTVMGVVDRHY